MCVSAVSLSAQNARLLHWRVLLRCFELWLEVPAGKPPWRGGAVPAAVHLWASASHQALPHVRVA